MVVSTVKGKASASKSECKALTLMSADSEPLKSSVEEAADSPVVGEGENNEVRNTDETSVDGHKKDENICGPVIGNSNKNEEQAGVEGHEEKRDYVNEIKVNRVNSGPISGETQGSSEDANNGGGVANMQQTPTQEVTVKDIGTVIYGLDIKDVNTRKERMSLGLVTDNILDGGGVTTPEEASNGDGVANMEEMTTQEVSVKDNEAVICGLDIKDVNTREEKMSLELVTDNIVDGDGVTTPEEAGDGDGVANIEEMTTLAMSEAVICVPDITDVNIREGRKSLELVTDNTVDGGGIANPEEVNDGSNIANMEEMRTQEVFVRDDEAMICELHIKDVNTMEGWEKIEVVTNNTVDEGGLANLEEVNGGVGVTNTEEAATRELLLKDNEIVTYVVGIIDVNTETERKLVKDNMVEGGSAASVRQVTSKNLTGNIQNEKEADKLNAETILGTISDNEKKECRRENESVADKATSYNVNIPKRKRLNRKVFEGNMQNEKEADNLNDETILGTISDNEKKECGRENESVADKANSYNVNIPKRKRLNRKVFEGNNVASANEAKAPSSTGNDAFNGAHEADTNEHVKNDHKAEAKPLVEFCRKLKRVRKREVPKGYGGIIAANEEQKSQSTNNEPENKENRKTDEQDLNNEEAEKSGNRVSQLQIIKEENVEKEHTIKEAAERCKFSTGLDCMGMIFMCSSETKEDCYRYRVLGLPAGKKDIVLKINKGMRLFLFDFNIKMMHGIYKAAGPGGYNIEPRAFKSLFPSQVRFTVLEDCIPLAEEKFRSVIKDYYTKKKFNCQLTSEQVKNLCKLFHETTKRAGSKIVFGSQIPAAPPSIQQELKRKRIQDSRRAGPVSSSEQERRWRHSEKRVRHYPMVISEMHQPQSINYERHVICERETYPQSITPPSLYQPVPAQNTRHSPSYSYGGALIVDMYRRDLALEHGEPSLCECRPPVEMDHHDTYVSYVKAHAYHEPAYETGATHAYLEPAYETGASHAYHEPAYETGASHAYHEPAYEISASHAYQEPAYEIGLGLGLSQECWDYCSDTHQVEYSGNSRYQPPLPPHRRYRTHLL